MRLKLSICVKHQCRHQFQMKFPNEVECFRQSTELKSSHSSKENGQLQSSTYCTYVCTYFRE